MTQNDYILPDNWEFRQHKLILSGHWRYYHLARNHLEGLFPVNNVLLYKLRTEAVKIKRIYINKSWCVPKWLEELTK